jgi:hypothetical protein
VQYLPNMVIPNGYLRLEDALKLARVSRRTLHKWTAQRHVGKRREGAIVLYNRADLERVLAESAETAIIAKPAGVPMVAQMTGAIGAALAEQFRRVLPLPAGQAALADLACKRFLTFPEAARLDGRSEAHLRELARAKRVVLRGQGPRGADLIRQADLERI